MVKQKVGNAGGYLIYFSFIKHSEIIQYAKTVFGELVGCDVSYYIVQKDIAK